MAVFVPRIQRLDHDPTIDRRDRVQAYTNSFELHFPTKDVYHYDVITPLWESQREVKIGTKKGNEIVQRAQSSNPSIFVQRAAFDGKKNLFAPVYYFAEQRFTVDWMHNPADDKKQRKVEVTMKCVNRINFEILRKYIQTQDSPQHQNEVNLMINMLNVLVSAVPKQKEGLLTTAKSVFVPPTQRNERNPIAPLELWRGYYQTVRPAFDKVIINVDITIGVVLPANRLEHICADYLKLGSLHLLRRLSPDNFQRLRHFLKGVKVTVDVGVHRGRPPKPIKDLVQNVGNETFEKDGTETRIGEHFAQTHNIQIPPSSLGVKLGTAGTFPILCCNTVEQFYKNRATPDVVRAALEFTPPNPSARATEIEKSFGHFDYANSEFLVGAGIRVDQRPQSIHGRRMKGLAIKFGNGAERRLDQRPGVWDVMRQKLVLPAPIQSWIVVDFARTDPSDLDYFIKELIKAMRELGMNVANPSGPEHLSVQVSVEKELQNLIFSRKPQMILAVLPDPAEDQYRRIKRFGDITHGVVTQCVRWSNNLRNNVKKGRVNQYQNNLILKINPKMGGTNFHAVCQSLEGLKKSPFMVVGADVSHPGPGSQMPSIASVVGSYDRDACRYAARVKVQSSRVETIEDFESMFDEVLGNFVTMNKGHFPRFLIIFRDGVSEGEFENVEKHEENAIHQVCNKRYPPDKRPKIIYIVVGKRHHVRFFPVDSRSADPKGNGNFHSGLVVDNEIVHPRFCDFYLQSQPGLKGTSIPSHYTILRNDPGVPALSIQELAYGLCHCYARSTRSVKIPAPVYYADLVCRRSKFHFHEDVHNYSAASVSGSEEDTDVHLDFYRQRFDNVNANLSGQMYYL